jgi:hypothetical protein
MNERVEVLLVGETAQSSLHLTQWLERRGCRCQFSSSPKEACNLIAGQAFDFVLSHFELPDNSAYPILEKLVGSATTLFFSKLIEDGCLWISGSQSRKEVAGGQGTSAKGIRTVLGGRYPRNFSPSGISAGQSCPWTRL